MNKHIAAILGVAGALGMSMDVPVRHIRRERRYLARGIQVAAPEGGIIFDIGHEQTQFEKDSDAFRQRCRMSRRLKFSGSTYRRDRGLRGKLNLKHVKREKVRAMKAAGHFRGDNRPFVQV